MKHSVHRTTTGFSLLELLVSIAIMVIITAIALANYPAARHAAALDSAVASIADAIRSVQVYSIGTASSSVLSANSLMWAGYTLGGCNLNGSNIKNANSDYFGIYLPNGAADYFKIFFDNGPTNGQYDSGECYGNVAFPAGVIRGETEAIRNDGSEYYYLPGATSPYTPFDIAQANSRSTNAYQPYITFHRPEPYARLYMYDAITGTADYGQEIRFVLHDNDTNANKTVCVYASGFISSTTTPSGPANTTKPTACI